MHLAILSQYYRPEIGAPQARLSNLASHFVRRGHSVTVLTAMPNYPTGKVYAGYRGLLRRENLEGVDIIRSFIYPTSKTDLLRRLTNYFSFVITSSVSGSLLLKPPDYLMVESPPLFLGLAGLWLSRFKRTRLIFNVSDLWPESALRLGVIHERGSLYRLALQLEALCYRHAWLVTGQSRSILENIVGRFPECKTFHLSNGVDISRFVPLCASQEAGATSKDRQEFVILYAGLHGIAQGLDQLLDAAKELENEKQFRIVMVGDGPEKKRLVASAERQKLSNVEFLDPLPAEQIPALLATADVIVVPLGLHLPGAVPSKLYEAMSCGRPVVLVASGEAAEIVHKHKAGITVVPGDVRGLVEAFRRLNSEPALRSELGQNGNQAASECFDRKEIADRFISLLEKNLAQSHTSGVSALSFHLDQDNLK